MTSKWLYSNQTRRSLVQYWNCNCPSQLHNACLHYASSGLVCYFIVFVCYSYTINWRILIRVYRYYYYSACTTIWKFGANIKLQRRLNKRFNPRLLKALPLTVRRDLCAHIYTCNPIFLYILSIVLPLLVILRQNRRKRVISGYTRNMPT